MLDAFMKSIYEGFDTEKEIEPNMYAELLRLMNEATIEGLSMSNFSIEHNREFLHAIKHSNEVFSAFKTHAMGRSMQAKLLDEKGRLKSYDRWAKEVRSISSHHVGAWLRTEYNTAVLRAHNAGDWREFMANKDIMPNLRWMPTTSPDAEATHRSFWEKKLTLPIEHPFWNKHHPGDRWNCKCALEATDEPASDDNIIKDIPAIAPQRGLENNPGKDGIILNDKHPYFPSSCASCDFYKNSGIKNKVKGWFRNQKKDCCNCGFINASLPNKEALEISKAKELIQEVVETKQARKVAYKIAELSSVESDFIKRKGITLESSDIHISDKAILHALRDVKAQRGASVSIEELQFFLDNINNKKNCSLYWHEKHQNLTYVTQYKGGVQKFVVELNYKLKANKQKFITNNFITAGELDDIRYISNDSTYIKIR